MKSKIRALAIKLLNDEQGINEDAYELLSNILEETGNKDILVAIDAGEGRFYISEQAAEALSETS